MHTHVYALKRISAKITRRKNTPQKTPRTPDSARLTNGSDTKSFGYFDAAWVFCFERIITLLLSACWEESGVIGWPTRKVVSLFG